MMRRIGARWRLRRKLSVALGVAALVPVALVAFLAVRVVFGSLERDQRRDAERQRDIALNVVLRSIEEVGASLFTLVDAPPLLADGSLDVAALRRRSERGDLPRGVLHVLAATDGPGPGAAWAVGGAAPLGVGDATIAARDPVVVSARGLARVIDVAVIDGVMVARAAAPITDASLQPRGVAVLTVALDRAFADRVAAALGANIVLATRDRSWSTFRAGDGTPLEVVTPPAVRLVDGGTAATIATVQTSGQPTTWQVAWVVLRDRARAPVGWLGVAVPRDGLLAAKQRAVGAMVLAAAVAVLLAVALALLLARGLARPLARLHTGAIAVARGDLDHRFDLPPGDELADLADAFTHMTAALRTNEARLEARVRELVALHDVGRAVAAEIELDAVAQTAVDSVARVFRARRASLWLAAEPGAAVAAVAARQRGVADRAVAIGLAEVDRPRAARAIGGVGQRAGTDLEAGRGPMLAYPLERGGAVLGAILVDRDVAEPAFTAADASLLATFAGQAAAAIENARLYAQLRGASEQLEQKVRIRTAELTAMNGELGRTLVELRDAQAQLLLSERMAGLGVLVASVAHEINSPSAAIRGSVDAVAGVVRRIGGQYAVLADADVAPERHSQLLVLIDELSLQLAGRPLPTGPSVRQRARTLRAMLADEGEAALAEQAARLAELGVGDPDVARLARALAHLPATLAPTVVEAIGDHVFLRRTVDTIRAAIGRIQRIVGALKSYSHVDRDAARVATDVHQGIEATLTLFDHALRDIDVRRRFGDVPPAPVFVDELNQVWTNLIQNAVQAMRGSGSLTIATSHEGDAAVVRVIDDGPGIPADVLPRIFDPFFTTKIAGEGSGLGLGIVRRIIDRHGGTITCTSTPGATEFTVRLPLVAAAVEAPP